MRRLLVVVYALYLAVVLYALFIAVYTALSPGDSLSLTPLNSSATMSILRSFDNHDDQALAGLFLHRLHRLRSLSSSSVLVHLHIPKTGGSALSLALTSDCVCNMTATAKHSDLCVDCKTVQGPYGSHVYSVSRFNGWKFGVHTPLHSLHRQSMRDIGRYGLQPVHIIALREPFDRFLSESISWAKDKYYTIDWSAKTHKRFEKMHSRRLRRVNTNQTVYHYVSLPMHFIIHNRQTKMIGGSFWEFDSTFVSRERIGSVWKPNDSEASIARVKERAKVILLTFSNYMLVIHERLEESLCALEIIFGDRYAFRLNTSIHAHNANGMFEQRKEAYDYKKHRSKYSEYMNSEIRKIWLSKNAADVELYRDAMRIFELQMVAALQVLNSSTWSPQDTRRYAPHCVDALKSPEISQSERG